MAANETSTKNNTSQAECARSGAWGVERTLRLIAGSFILLSVGLAHLLSPKWLYFTAFVGLNLFQSAFTNWCPMMAFLRKAGMK